MDQKKKKRIALYFKIGIVILVLILGGLAFAFYQVSSIAKNLPDPKNSINWQMKESTKIYDKTGKIVLYEVNDQGKRTVLANSEIPDLAKKATIALEDQSFYDHSAIDWKALMRAVFVNIKEGSYVQGGSTITQQLAKNAFLTTEKTITRKIKELILSYWIERYYTKDEILALYLNQIPYGAGANGIEAGAQTYFGKSAKDLNLAETTALISIPRSPSLYSPWTTNGRKRLSERQAYALEQMVNLGYITKSQRSEAKSTPTKFLEQNLGSIKAPHFSLMVKEYLVEKYGEDVVNKGGLKVITTLDYDLQQIAEKAVKDGAAKNKELYKGNNASLVAQDPKTGHILAMVGSADYFDKSIDGNFNVAAQGLRQPGSSIKPFAYVAAFQKGFTPDTLVFDVPTNFDTSGDPRNAYEPENFDHKFIGPVNLRNALAQSRNIPAVKALYLAGMNETIELSNAFGIETLTDPKRYGLTLVLGGGEVKLVDMVEAYSVFSQDGIKHKQSFIIKVTDQDNNVLEKYIDKSQKVIDSQYTALINDILSDTEARRPLFEGSFNLTVFDDRQVALKTGTTNDYRDAWAMGYTPYLTVGVWAGNNNNQPMQRNAGSILAAIPIWNAFLKEALPKFPNETFTRPEYNNNQKPMLNGQYSYNGQIHDILYYVDKSNPLGDMPSNPSSDPQFANWENGLLRWLNQNTLTINPQSTTNNNLNQPILNNFIPNLIPIQN